jgi:hypothetical protein
MMRALFSISTALLCCGAVAGSLGCGSPSQANIELRKENQQLRQQLSQLKILHEGDQRTIQGLRDRVGTLPTLSTTRLAELFSTHGLTFGRLTGAAELDPAKPGNEGLAIYISPIDETGGRLKAAGTFDIDAFDLAEPKDPLLGHWHFNLQQSRSAWTEVLLEYGYALMCPWQNKPPKHPDVTIKVTFFDELTQTPFSAQQVVHVAVAPKP